MFPSFLLIFCDNAVSYTHLHHQVAGRLGAGFYTSAFSEENYVEAMEHENGRILAVQWHPELMEDDQILPYFLDVVCA